MRIWPRSGPLPTRTASGRNPSTTRSPVEAAEPLAGVVAEVDGGRADARSARRVADGTRFIAGEPMNPATNRLAGSWYSA